MKKTISLVIFIFISLFLVSCTKTTTTKKEVTITTKKTTVSTNTTKKAFTPIQKDYNLVENRVYDSNYDICKYDIYLPKDLSKDANLNVVLFIHGGAWVYGSKEDYASLLTPFSKFIVGTLENTVLVAMNYRLLSFEENSTITIYSMLEDIDNCISDVKTYLLNSGYSTNSIMIGGHSAGGHLALLYSYTKTPSIPLKFVYSLSGPTDIDLEVYTPIAESMFTLLPEEYQPYATRENFLNVVRKAVIASKEDNLDDKLDLVSPITFVSSSKVPTIIFHGDDDAIVPYQNSLDLELELKNNKVDYALITISDGTHNDTSVYSKMKKYGFLETFYNYFIEFVK